MKKVLFVNTNTEKSPYPVPPVGINILAGYIKEKFNVKIYDAVFKKDNELTATVKDFKPDYIAFSIRNVDDMVLENTKFYIEDIKNKFVIPVKKITNAPIILGGSGYSIFPESLLEKFGADYGIIGEGEVPLSKLLSELEKGNNNVEIPGVISTNSKFGLKKRYTFENLDKLPFSSIDEKTEYFSDPIRNIYSIQSKRGCYHKCIYCTYPIIEGSKFRSRSPQNIVDEIEQVSKRLKNITFEFVDSTFNDPPGHAEKICKEVIKRKLKVKFRTMGINPRHTSVELFELMKAAGFTQIDSTPDSASPKMLKNLKKGFKLEHLIKTSEYIKQTGLPTMWFFLFGGPGEDEHTINESFDFIDNYIYKMDMVHLTFGMRIYPNTDLHKTAIQENVISKDTALLLPLFYISEKLGRKKLEEILYVKSRKRPNCIPASESTPSKEMIQQAMALKKKLKLEEPMFRTLLRVCYGITCLI